jgi:hypothetical protein
MPSIRAYNGTNLVMFAHDNVMKNDTPFEKGAWQWPFMTFANRPNIYEGILSDDQRSPVFVIGFRIPLKPN